MSSIAVLFKNLKSTAASLWVLCSAREATVLGLVEPFWDGEEGGEGGSMSEGCLGLISMVNIQGELLTKEG